MRYILLHADAEDIALPDGTARSGRDGIAITSSTNATPIVVTKAAHGLATGDKVYIAGHVTNTAANGLFTVTRLSSSTFSLDDSVGNGVGGATGTFRSDIITLTDDQYEALSPTAIDGDPIIDLGAAPSIDGDEVTEQGVSVTTTATAPVAITSSAPAVATYAAPTQAQAAITGGESPTEVEFNTLRTDLVSTNAKLAALAVDAADLRTVLTAVRVDVGAIRTRQATIITQLVALDAALSGTGKAIAT